MDYHEDTSDLTKTQLSIFIDCPAEYEAQFITHTMPRKKQTAEMIVGVCCHAAMIEHRNLDDIIGVYPDSCLKSDKTLNGKPAAKHRAENPGKYWMKEHERDNIKKVYERLKDTAIADAIRASTKFEYVWKANLYGRNCKCMTDIAGDTGSQWDVWDLKFTDNIRQFYKTSKQFKYWLQDAHYSPIVTKNVGKPVSFRFLVAETVPPYRVRIHYYDEIKREAAAKFHKSQILNFIACEQSGKWPDTYDPHLPLSEYDLGASDVLFDDEALDAINESVDDYEEMEMPF